jgi:hypothetical protein
MRHHIFSILGMVFLFAAPTMAQGILPGSFAGWAGVLNPGAPASGAASEQTAAQQEYGFVSAEQGAYSRGNETLQVTLYRMTDPSGAYGWYSYLRSPDMPHADMTDHSAISRERAQV